MSKPIITITLDSSSKLTEVTTYHEEGDNSVWAMCRRNDKGSFNMEFIKSNKLQPSLGAEITNLTLSYKGLMKVLKVFESKNKESVEYYNEFDQLQADEFGSLLVKAGMVEGFFNAESIESLNSENKTGSEYIQYVTSIFENIKADVVSIVKSQPVLHAI